MKEVKEVFEVVLYGLGILLLIGGICHKYIGSLRRNRTSDRYDVEDLEARIGGAESKAAIMEECLSKKKKRKYQKLYRLYLRS